MIGAGAAYIFTGLGTPPPAGVVTWDAGADYNGNAAQVSNNGARHAAVCFTTTATTVNGLIFDPPTTVSGTNTTVSFAKSSPVTVSSGSNGSSASGGSGSYGTLVSSGNWHQNAAGTITIGGLVAGLDYQVQIFMPYWDNQYPTDFGIGGSNEITLLCGRNTGTPTAAQYAIGTFTATGTTRAISYESSPASGTSAALAAVSVRNLDGSAVTGSGVVGTNLGLIPDFHPLGVTSSSMRRAAPVRSRRSPRSSP